MKLFHARYAQPIAGGGVAIEEDDFYLPDEHSVRRQLRNKGYYPIRIYEQKPPLFEWMDVRSREWQIQLLRALRFQTATASAGTALLNIIEGETDSRRRLAFLPTRTVLKGGGAFSEALAKLKLMDAATMAIITAGERAGDLKGVIQHAIEHVEQKGKQYKTMVAALGWFAFDIISIVGSMWGAQFGFIPYLKNEGVKGENVDPAAIEKFNRGIEIASWANGSLMFITMALMGAIVGIGVSFWMNRSKHDHISARLVMNMPVFSSYLRHNALQDTCKLMSRLLNGKVPLAEALTIIIDGTYEPSARKYWTESRDRIMAGVEPSRALARWPLNKAESDQIHTIQSVDQLSEVYEAIAAERQLMGATDRRKIVMGGVMLMMFLFISTTLVMIYLLMLQNQGFLNSLGTLREGG